MTVRHLIELLSKMNPDAYCVIVSDRVEDEPISFPVQDVTEYVPGEITIEY